MLLALDRYFHTYEKATPDFVARVWLGERYAGEHAFRGRTTERHHVEIPMRAAGGGPVRRGPDRWPRRGRAASTTASGLRYAPASLDLAPADHGFAVERTYEAVDDPDDVRRERDGTWRIRAGARVRVRVTMAAEARRYHVALVDPLPAGLEPMNPALATTGTIPERARHGGRGRRAGPGPPGRPGTGGGGGASGSTTRTCATSAWRPSRPCSGRASTRYRYVARATTPGRFVVPPPRAEEMYAPETFGRGGTDRVVVEMRSSRVHLTPWPSPCPARHAREAEGGRPHRRGGARRGGAAHRGRGEGPRRLRGGGGRDPPRGAGRSPFPSSPPATTWPRTTARRRRTRALRGGGRGQAGRRRPRGRLGGGHGADRQRR